MPDEAAQRRAIVAEARTWIGTPYHNCADIKGAGVDCGMLLVRIFVDIGLVAPFDPRPYPSDWHMHHNAERYLGWVTDRSVEVTTPQPGDIVLFHFGRCYSHGGIVTTLAPLRLVHAFATARMVLEDELDRNIHLSQPRRHPRFFSPWGAP